MMRVPVLNIVGMAVNQPHEAEGVALRIVYQLLMEVEFRDVLGIANMKTRSVAWHCFIADEDVFVIQIGDVEVFLNLFVHQLFEQKQVDFWFYREFQHEPVANFRRKIILFLYSKLLHQKLYREVFGTMRHLTVLE